MTEKIMILTDSASDFTSEQLTEYDIRLVPMTLVCGEASYQDDKTRTNGFLWEHMKNGTVCKTSQPSPSAFLDFFAQAKAEHQTVICILISSALSGTLQSASIAKSMADYENIYIIDSKNAAAAQKLLVQRACTLRREGNLSAAEIVEELEDFRKRIRLFACIDTLEYLVRGGRLSKAAGTLGSFLSIKPILTLSLEGTIEIVHKSRGIGKSIEFLCNILDNNDFDPAYPILPLYVCDKDNCLKMLEKLKNHPHFSCIQKPDEIGPTIGCHVGPGGFGFAYVEK